MIAISSGLLNDKQTRIMNDLQNLPVFFRQSYVSYERNQTKVISAKDWLENKFQGIFS